MFVMPMSRVGRRRNKGLQFVTSLDNFSGLSSIRLPLPWDAREVLFEISNISLSASALINLQFYQSGGLVNSAGAYAWEALQANSSATSTNTGSTSNTSINLIYNTVIQWTKLHGSYRLRLPSVNGMQKCISGTGGGNTGPAGAESVWLMSGRLLANTLPIEGVLFSVSAGTFSGNLEMYKEGS